MRILFCVHQWLPRHAAGGEMYCANMAQELKKRGHEVRVLLTEAGHYGITDPYVYEDIEVFVPTKDITPLFWWSEIVITHLQVTPWAAAMCKILKRPLVFVSHNTHPYDIVIASVEWPNMMIHHRRPPVGVIYNSKAMKEILNYQNNSTVLTPIIDQKKYDFGGPKGEFITLVNLNGNKGGKLFMALARAMPDRKFMGVGGAYETQFGEVADNVVLMPNSPDMAPVYAQTRILLCPSAYESWGMAASEAMCNGIPVIYNPTFGLKENVGECGIPVPNVNPDYFDYELKGGEHSGIDHVANLKPWMKAIKSLDNPKTYQKYSLLSVERMKAKDSGPELNDLQNFLENEIGNFRRLQG